MFGERHFGVLFGMLKLNLLLGDFRQSDFAINSPMILSIPRISEIKLRTQFSQNIGERKLKCLWTPFKLSFSSVKWVAPDPVSSLFKEKVSSSERHMWAHVKAAATKMSILYWFYNYFLQASFEAQIPVLPTFHFCNTSNEILRFLTSHKHTFRSWACRLRVAILAFSR